MRKLDHKGCGNEKRRLTPDRTALLFSLFSLLSFHCDRLFPRLFLPSLSLSLPSSFHSTIHAATDCVLFSRQCSFPSTPSAFAEPQHFTITCLSRPLLRLSSLPLSLTCASHTASASLFSPLSSLSASTRCAGHCARRATPSLLSLSFFLAAPRSSPAPVCPARGARARGAPLLRFIRCPW